MILRVRDVERVAVQRHALRIVEPRLLERPVHEPGVRPAGDCRHPPVQRRDHDPVVIGVRDEEPVAPGVREHLAGKREGTRRLLLPLRDEVDGTPVDCALRVELGHHLADQPVERVVLDLPLVLADHLAPGVDEHQRRPRPHCVLSPHLELAVVDHWMLDLVPEDRLADVLSGLLSVELGRMDAYHCQLAAVLLFQFPQLRKYVHAVDSTVRPEVQHHQLPTKLSQRHRPLRVEPVEPSRKLRRIHLPRIRFRTQGQFSYSCAREYPTRSPPPPSFPRSVCPRAVGGGNPSPAGCTAATPGAVCGELRGEYDLSSVLQLCTQWRHGRGESGRDWSAKAGTCTGMAQVTISTTTQASPGSLPRHRTVKPGVAPSIAKAAGWEDWT